MGKNMDFKFRNVVQLAYIQSVVQIVMKSRTVFSEGFIREKYF